MVVTEPLTIDRETPLTSPGIEERAAAERAARESLRAQVAKLEGELSGIVARGFPHISPAPFVAPERAGPRLLSLAELERERDRLVMCLRRAQAQARERAELELRSRDLLERMRLEPGQYRFVRLRVADLGERGCGMWEVRPRLGLIGMLAGWWQLKLSSGCPLPRPRAHGARRLSMRGGAVRCNVLTARGVSRCEAVRSRARSESVCTRLHAPGARRPGASRSRAAPAHGSTPHLRGCAPGRVGGGRSPAPKACSPAEGGDGALLAAHRGERLSLTLGERGEGLGFGDLQLRQQLPAAALAPAALAHQQVGDRHALSLPGAFDDHVGGRKLAGGDSSLEVGAGEAHLVGAFEGTHVLRTGRGQRRCRAHLVSLPVVPVTGVHRGAQHTCLNF
jgi:hypothetical protein